MAVQPQIAYRDVEPSPALERLIQAETAKLERFFHGIVTCRVLVEHSHGRDKHGSPYNVRIDLSLPGAELVVNHVDDVRPVPAAGDDEPERVHKAAEREGHKDPQLAVRTAFNTMTRRLQEYVKQLRP
jgi:ribosome-associated translation inhibitor RaiA